MAQPSPITAPFPPRTPWFFESETRAAGTGLVWGDPADGPVPTRLMRYAQPMLKDRYWWKYRQPFWFQEFQFPPPYRFRPFWFQRAQFPYGRA